MLFFNSWIKSSLRSHSWITSGSMLICSTLAFGSRGLHFKSWWWRNIFLFRFWIEISWLPFTFELIPDYANESIHRWIHQVWLLIRLTNLIARKKIDKKMNKFWPPLSTWTCTCPMPLCPCRPGYDWKANFYLN